MTGHAGQPCCYLLQTRRGVQIPRQPCMRLVIMMGTIITQAHRLKWHEFPARVLWRQRKIVQQTSFKWTFAAVVGTETAFLQQTSDWWIFGCLPDLHRSHTTHKSLLVTKLNKQYTTSCTYLNSTQLKFNKNEAWMVKRNTNINKQLRHTNKA